MNAEPLLAITGLQKRFGGFTALDDISLSVFPGERLGLIGPNGSGKSTFTNCLCGTLRADAGAVRFAGRHINRLGAYQRTRLGIARSFQLPRPFHSLSLAENVRIPLLYTVNARPGQRLSELAIATRTAELLGHFGLAGKAERLPRDLTQVEMRKLELARAMATDPTLLIADEAMAGLSNSEVDEILLLLMALNRQGVAIIFIEHIMRAVMAFSERLVVFVAGQKIADGPPREVIADHQVIGAYLGQ
jgi:branched-chain amino acid transport system ATP-binding protein